MDSPTAGRHCTRMRPVGSRFHASPAAFASPRSCQYSGALGCACSCALLGALSQRRVSGQRECGRDMSPPIDSRRSRAGHPTVAARRPPASEPSSAEALSAPFGWRMAATLRDTCTGPQRNIAQHWLQASPYLTPHRCGLLVMPGGSCFPAITRARRRPTVQVGSAMSAALKDIAGP